MQKLEIFVGYTRKNTQIDCNYGETKNVYDNLCRQALVAGEQTCIGEDLLTQYKEFFKRSIEMHIRKKQSQS